MSDPSRRQFLVTAGGAALGAAALAACSSSGGPRATPSSTTASTTSSTTTSTTTTTVPETTTTLSPAAENDLALVRTLTSVELLLVTAYNALAGYDLLQTDAVASAELFRDHHLHHASDLQDLTVRLGGSSVSGPNGYLRDHVLSPSLLNLRQASSQAAIRFAYMLERSLTSTYVSFAGQLSRPKLRRDTMATGAVEARHAAVWSTQLGVSAIGFYDDALWAIEGHPGEGDGIIPTDALLDAS